MSLVKWGKEKLCNDTQDGTQGGTQSGTQDTQADTEGDTQMILKNKLLPYSTIQYLPKTKLGSLLITSKLPMVYERRILVLLLKSYVQYILCIYVYMYSRGCVISLWRTLFVFSPFSRYGTEKNVFIYNKAQTFTSSGFAFPQKICIFAENFFKYGKDTNKIWNSAWIELFS